MLSNSIGVFCFCQFKNSRRCRLVLDLITENTNCKFIERLQNLEFETRIIERKGQSLVFSSMIYKKV